MTWRRLRIGAACAATGFAAALAAAPPAAHACSFIPACGAPAHLGLVGDPTARPTNACILFRYRVVPWYGEPFTAALAYVDASGRRTELTPSAFPDIYCPVALLMPETEHVLVGPEAVPNDSGLCDPVGEVELLRFRTSAGADLTPPSQPGAPHDEWCSWAICENSGCCGPYDTVMHRTVWDPSTDESDAVVYAIGGAVREGVVHVWTEDGVIQPMPVAPHDTLRPTDIRAIDIAGTPSEPAAMGTTCERPPRPEDAGVTPDARVTPDAAPPAIGSVDADTILDAGPSASGGGCSIVARRPRMLDLLVLPLLGVWARRTRRKWSSTRPECTGS